MPAATTTDQARKIAAQDTRRASRALSLANQSRRLAQVTLDHVAGNHPDFTRLYTAWREQCDYETMTANAYAAALQREAALASKS